MKKIVLSLVTLMVLGTSTGFCKTVNNRGNNNQPRTEQVSNNKKVCNITDVCQPTKKVVTTQKNDVKVTCNKDVKPSEKCNCKNCQKQQKKVQKQTKKCNCKSCQKQNKQIVKSTKTVGHGVTTNRK